MPVCQHIIHHHSLGTAKYRFSRSIHLPQLVSQSTQKTRTDYRLRISGMLSTNKNLIEYNASRDERSVRTNGTRKGYGEATHEIFRMHQRRSIKLPTTTTNSRKECHSSGAIDAASIDHTHNISSLPLSVFSVFTNGRRQERRTFRKVAYAPQVFRQVQYLSG